MLASDGARGTCLEIWNAHSVRRENHAGFRKEPDLLALALDDSEDEHALTVASLLSSTVDTPLLAAAPAVILDAHPIAATHRTCSLPACSG